MSRPAQTDDEKQLLARIDAAVDRIRKQVRIELPYFLTGKARDTATRAAPYNWHKDSFFDSDEEHLQYQTWLYREDAEDLATLDIHGGIEEQRRREDKSRRQKPKETRRDKPRKVAERIAREGSASSGDDRSKSKQSSPKKKISLAEYKKKKLGGGDGADSSAQEDRDKAKTAARNADSSSGIERAKTNGTAGSSRQEASRRDRERADEIDEFEIEPLKQETSKRDHSRDNRAMPVKTQAASKRSPSPFDIPELHSPIDLGDAAKSPAHGFPPLLSPLRGLPSAFTRDLEAHKARQKRTAGESREHDTEKPAEKRVKTARDRTDSDLSNTSIHRAAGVKAEEQRERDGKASDLKAAPEAVKRSAEANATNEREAKKLIVRLRYSKKRRSEVDRILRARSDSKLQPPMINEARSSEQKAVNGTGSHNKPQQDGRNMATASDGKAETPVSKSKPAKGSNFLTPNNKRSREDEPGETGSNKRQQIDPSASSNKPKFTEPSTPRKADHLSPLAATKRPPPATKSLPRSSSSNSSAKDSKATAMARNDSQHSVDSGPRTTQVTPVPSTRVGPTSTPQPNGTTVNAVPLWRMNEELSALGKQLKTVFDDIRKRVLESGEGRGVQVSREEKRKGAVAGLESLCAYILMFTCRDSYDKITHRAPSGSRFSEWHSILPLFSVITFLTRSDPSLRGLHAHLGVGIANRILTRWTELPRDLRNSDRKIINDKLTAQDVLDNALKEMQGWAADAWRDLGIEEIMTAYPKTWEQREKKGRGGAAAAAAGGGGQGEESNWEVELLATAVELAGSAGKDGKMFSHAAAAATATVSDGKEGGKFPLPLAADSSPVQVVRFATSVLREYVEKEGLDYKIRVHV